MAINIFSKVVGSTTKSLNPPKALRCSVMQPVSWDIVHGASSKAIKTETIIVHRSEDIIFLVNPHRPGGGGTLKLCFKIYNSLYFPFITENIREACYFFLVGGLRGGRVVRGN